MKKYFLVIEFIPMLQLIPIKDKIELMTLKLTNKVPEIFKGSYFVWLCFVISWGWYKK